MEPQAPQDQLGLKALPGPKEDRLAQQDLPDPLALQDRLAPQVLRVPQA
jgi:hypothetical protein